jgi:hypothetical protein
VHTARKPFELAPIRLSDIRKLIAHRYGSVLPATMQAVADLRVLLNQLAMVRNGNQLKRVTGAVRELAPWMPDDDVYSLVDGVCRRPLRFKAETAGTKMQLRYEEKRAIRATTIRAVDEPSQTQKERVRKMEQRRAAGVKPRASKPWLAYGLAKATYYRRKAAGTLPQVAETECPDHYTLRGTGHSVSQRPAAFEVGPRTDWCEGFSSIDDRSYLTACIALAGEVITARYAQAQTVGA